MSDFNPGQHIGDYEVISILGAGGMGKVYKVRNLISDRTEALKVLLPDLTSQQSLADRFLREIRLLATLCHPNIAALRTALTFENQLVMVMEFVEGETIANRIARAPISTSDAVNYSDQALSALLGDLSDRGLLDDTLVLVMGEFGRTPRIGQVVMNAATNSSGRDHWPHAYTVLAAGAGLPGGTAYGATDGNAGQVIEGPIGPPDLQATVLHLLGLDPGAATRGGK